MKNALFAGALSCLLTFGAAPVFAGELEGVKMPDQVSVGGKTLTLNGMGIRKATFLKVKVYVAGLYLESPSHSGEQIKGSPGIKQVDMKFVRDVDAGKIRDAWSDSFEEHCKPNCQSLQPKLKELNSLMTDVKSGDTMTYTFYPDRVEVSVKGAKKGSIEGMAFGQVMLSSWMGPDPMDSGLSNGMLGKK